jgi:hypothetical protein
MRKFILTAMLAVIPGSISPVCQAQEPTPGARSIAESKPAAGDPEQMRTSITRLTTENERLRAKVTELERRLRNQSIRDRMTQEEQRAENLGEQLFLIAKEESDLQAQLEEVNEQLRPENIQQLPILGSLRPEEVRESTRRKLSNQQMRLQAQIQLLQQSRARIQSSMSVTDMLIQNLRAQMQAPSHP